MKTVEGNKDNEIMALIRQTVPHPLFSETYTTLGITSKSTCTIKQDYRQSGAVLIVIHSIILSMTNVVDTVIAKDKFNRTLMQFNLDTSMNGLYSLKHVLPSGLMFLQFTQAGAFFKDFYATAQYQYVWNAEMKNFEDKE